MRPLKRVYTGFAQSISGKSMLASERSASLSALHAPIFCPFSFLLLGCTKNMEGHAYVWV